MADPLLIERYLPAGRCRELRDAFATGMARPRGTKGRVDRRLRDTEFVPTGWDQVPELERLVETRVKPRFGRALRVDPVAPVMIYRYPEGVGFEPHSDAVTPLEQRRAPRNGQPIIDGDLTLVVALSEPGEYEGGELYFPDRELSFKPPLGSVVAFPATDEYIHGVAPITAGTRFTAVARCYVVSE